MRFVWIMHALIYVDDNGCQVMRVMRWRRQQRARAPARSDWLLTAPTSQEISIRLAANRPNIARDSDLIGC